MDLEAVVAVAEVVLLVAAFSVLEEGLVVVAAAVDTHCLAVEGHHYPAALHIETALGL